MDTPLQKNQKVSGFTNQVEVSISESQNKKSIHKKASSRALHDTVLKTSQMIEGSEKQLNIWPLTIHMHSCKYTYNHYSYKNQILHSLVYKHTQKT